MSSIFLLLVGAVVGAVGGYFLGDALARTEVISRLTRSRPCSDIYELWLPGRDTFAGHLSVTKVVNVFATIPAKQYVVSRWEDSLLNTEFPNMTPRRMMTEEEIALAAVMEDACPHCGGANELDKFLGHRCPVKMWMEEPDD